MKKSFTAAFILVNALVSSHAVEFNSGDSKVRLLELYTSQSCSSCPPAEKWVTSFKKTDSLWKKFVPISYHVSYWNHLSWNDTFSKDLYSKRQRDYHRVIKAGVYTPQFVLDGKDFRSWRTTRQSRALHSNEKVGNLKVSFDEKKGVAKLSLKTKGSRELQCFAAYLESNHPVKITSGENEGAFLSQDFVAIHLAKSDAKKMKSDYTCNVAIKTKTKKSKIKRSMAFWLIDKKTYQVVQATGGDLK